MYIYVYVCVRPHVCMSEFGSGYGIGQGGWIRKHMNRLGTDSLLVLYTSSSSSPPSSLTLHNTSSYSKVVKVLHTLHFTERWCYFPLKKNAEGYLYIRGVNNQYVTNAAFLVSVHSDYQTAAGLTLQCQSVVVTPATEFAFAKFQVQGSRLLKEGKLKEW